jgi:hypothetical protein
MLFETVIPSGYQERKMNTRLGLGVRAFLKYVLVQLLPHQGPYFRDVLTLASYFSVG